MGKETNLENLSSEELKKLKEDRVNFMKEQLESLKVQDEFSCLKANIAENSLREYMSKIKLINLKMPPEKPGDKEPEPNTK
tara:strand:- start:199 stop:441 length:243 start_codon:yes stop_codon:yes gene_type:complete